MTGFVDSTYARCGPLRRNIAGVYFEGGCVSRLGDEGNAPYGRASLPTTPNESRWAVRWHWEPEFRLGEYCAVSGKGRGDR
jgi:hypothetical protein